MGPGSPPADHRGSASAGRPDRRCRATSFLSTGAWYPRGPPASTKHRRPVPADLSTSAAQASARSPTAEVGCLGAAEVV